MRNGTTHPNESAREHLRERIGAASHRVAEKLHVGHRAHQSSAAGDLGAVTREWAEEVGEILRHRAHEAGIAARERARKARETTRRRAAYAREIAYRRYEEAEPLKGFAAGMIGGLAGSWAMSQFLNSVERAKKARAERRGELEEMMGDEEGREPATVRAAERVSEKVFHHELSSRAKKVAGPTVHYGFGGLMGGCYGAVAEFVPEVTAGAGLPFGTLLFLGADEVAVPALHLAPKPREVPASEHAAALTAHLIYGGTAEIVRKVVRGML